MGIKNLVIFLTLVCSGCQDITSSTVNNQPTDSPSPSPIPTLISYTWNLTGLSSVSAGVCSGPYYIISSPAVKTDTVFTVSIGGTSAVKLFESSGCVNPQIDTLTVSLGQAQSEPFYLLDSTTQSIEMAILKVYVGLNPDLNSSPDAFYTVLVKQPIK